MPIVPHNSIVLTSSLIYTPSENFRSVVCVEFIFVTVIKKFEIKSQHTQYQPKFSAININVEILGAQVDRPGSGRSWKSEKLVLAAP